jgi:hypothetical protein
MVGRISDRDIKQGGFFKDCPVMREGIEAESAMIASHPAGIDPSEREVFTDELHHHIIDANSSGGCLPQYFTLF